VHANRVGICRQLITMEAHSTLSIILITHMLRVTLRAARIETSLGHGSSTWAEKRLGHGSVHAQIRCWTKYILVWGSAYNYMEKFGCTNVLQTLCVLLGVCPNGPLLAYGTCPPVRPSVRPCVAVSRTGSWLKSITQEKTKYVTTYKAFFMPVNTRTSIKYHHTT